MFLANSQTVSGGVALQWIRICFGFFARATLLARCMFWYVLPVIPNFLGAMNGFIEELLDARAYVAGPASHPQGFIRFQVSIVFTDCVPRELDISCGSRPGGMFLAFSYSLVGDGLCHGG